MTRFSVKQISKYNYRYLIIMSICIFVLFHQIGVNQWNEEIDIYPQDEPKLIEIVRTQFIDAPSTKQYRLLVPYILDPSHWQAEEIRKLLKNMTNGFFVESGGFDGEYYSNSLYFERFMGWKGILIEPDDLFYRKLRFRNRKCWSTNACLSPSTYPKKFIFQRNGWASALLNYSRQDTQNGYSSVQCLPLYSILLALNVTKVDYLSLDVEGVEFEVLKSIPWDKVNVTTISVETQFLSRKEEDLVEYMENLGYRQLTNYIRNNFYRYDLIFYHPNLLPL